MTKKQIIGIIKTIPDDYLPLFLSDVATTAFDGIEGYTASQKLDATLLKLKEWLPTDEFARISTALIKLKTFKLIELKHQNTSISQFKKATENLQLIDAKTIAQLCGFDVTLVRLAMRQLYNQQHRDKMLVAETTKKQPKHYAHPGSDSKSRQIGLSYAPPLTPPDKQPVVFRYKEGYKINNDDLQALLELISQIKARRQK